MRRLVGVALVVLVAVITLSGCSRKRTTSSNYGLSYCDGPLGQFDVYTIPNAGGLYDVYVVPYRVTSPGDRVTIGIANGGLDSQRTLVSEVVIQNDQEILAGSISGNELMDKEMLGIKLFSASSQSLLGDRQNDNYCSLPMPGDSGTAAQ